MPETRCVRSLIAALIVGVLLVGCASAPPPPVANSLVVTGDSAQVIAERGYQLVPVYQFVLDGHQYAFAHAYSEAQRYELIFIDAALACSSATPIDELTRWEWVGETDGLAYVASRLRQACGLEPGTAPRTLPFATDSDQSPRIASQHWLGYTGDPAEALLRSGTNFITVAAFVLAWPVMVPAAVIYGASDGTSESSAGAAGHKVGLRMQAISLPAADTVIAQQLGMPALQFVLPDAQTTVLGYAVDSGRAMYVGVVDGQAVWIHDSYPWLDRLAKRAIKEQKKQR